MTDPMAATPGWVDSSLERIFSALPRATKPAQDAFAECLARAKQPAAPSDLLGTEFTDCHRELQHALEAQDVPRPQIADTMRALEALEAEIDKDS